MEEIATTLTNFFEAFPAWVNAALTMIVAASAITALTPSAEDDRFLARVRRVLEFLALNIGHAARKP
jgi:uncharacterized MAPEG superfamily protein